MERVLTGKSVLAFDWDGTLLDSMPIKQRTFSELLAEALRPFLADAPPDLARELRLRYQALSGAPRREIVETIARELGLDPHGVGFEDFSARLSETNQRELASAPLFPDAVDFLTRVTTPSRAVYISSSVPQSELSAVVGARLPAELRSRLAGVLGSDGPFTKGPPHIERVLRETKVGRPEILFFGDDLADARLCRLADVECVLVDRRGELGGIEPGVKFIPDFGPLISELAEAESS